MNIIFFLSKKEWVEFYILFFSGSADRTVKFWDLETFELIGSTRPEVSEVFVLELKVACRLLSLSHYFWIILCLT